MKRTVMLVLGLAALSTVAGETGGFARVFLSHVNLEAPGLEAARTLAAGGEESRALEVWRDTVVYRLRALPLGEFGWHGNQGHPVAQAAVEKQLGKVELSAEEIGGMAFGAPMAYRYWKTNDQHVIDRWFDFAAQAATNGTICNNDSWGVGTYTIRTLGAFAKLLPDGQPRPDWGNVLAPRAGTVTPEGLALFPPEKLARIAMTVTLAWPDSPRGLVQFAKPGRVPNQRLGGLESLLMASMVFDSLKRAPGLQKVAGEAVLDVATTAFHPDGGDLEQSFNYNFGDAKSLRGLTALYGANPPAWCQEVNATVARFHDLMAGLTTPWGGLPRVGNYGGSNVPELWRDPKVRATWQAQLLKGNTSGGADQARDDLTRRLVNRLFGADGESPLPFTSIAFPYSGYYVLRGGWSWDSPYAFFMGARPGRGHSMRDRNAVQIAAFGRRLLVSAGPGTYGFGTMPDTVRRYFDEDSGYKCNTVIVNGRRQTQVNGVAVRAYRDPIPLRWHTSPTFDLVEGQHDSGYGENFNANRKGRQAIDTSVRHLRQLLFLRGDTPLWIVTDRLLSSEPGKTNTFTQMWHLPPPAAAGFSREQVAADEAARTVRTTDPAGPNVTLRHFAAWPLRYATYWGQTNEPALGWYAHGLGDPRQPAVDVHVNWQGAGDQTLVTALIPSRAGASPVTGMQDLSADGRSGCRMTLTDGRVVHYAAASRPMKLQAASAEAMAAALLVLTDAQGAPVGGMALDCQSLTVGGQELALPLADVQFSREADGRLQITPLFKRLVPEINPPGASCADFTLAEPVSLTSPQPGLDIHYTLDGSEPTLTSPLYKVPFKIKGPCTLKARLARGELLYPDAATETFETLTAMRTPDTSAARLVNGINYAYFEAEPNDNEGWKQLSRAVREDVRPKKTGVLDYFSAKPWERRGKTLTVFSGYVSVPRDGLYRFTVKGDGLSVYIHNPERETAAPISIAASAPGETEVTGKIALRAGQHRFRLDYSYYWGATLPESPVDISGPGLPRQPLPREWLWRDAQ